MKTKAWNMDTSFFHETKHTCTFWVYGNWDETIWREVGGLNLLRPRERHASNRTRTINNQGYSWKLLQRSETFSTSFVSQAPQYSAHTGHPLLCWAQSLLWSIFPCIGSRSAPAETWYSGPPMKTLTEWNKVKRWLVGEQTLLRRKTLWKTFPAKEGICCLYHETVNPFSLRVSYGDI